MSTIEQLFVAFMSMSLSSYLTPFPFRNQKPNDCAVALGSKCLDAVSTKLFVSGMINLELIKLCEQMMNFCYTISFEDS